VVGDKNTRHKFKGATDRKFLAKKGMARGGGKGGEKKKPALWLCGNERNGANQ